MQMALGSAHDIADVLIVGVETDCDILCLGEDKASKQRRLRDQTTTNNPTSSTHSSSAETAELKTRSASTKRRIAREKSTTQQSPQCIEVEALYTESCVEKNDSTRTTTLKTPNQEQTPKEQHPDTMQFHESLNIAGIYSPKPVPFQLPALSAAGRQEERTVTSTGNNGMNGTTAAYTVQQTNQRVSSFDMAAVSLDQSQSHTGSSSPNVDIFELDLDWMPYTDPAARVTKETTPSNTHRSAASDTSNSGILSQRSSTSAMATVPTSTAIFDTATEKDSATHPIHTNSDPSTIIASVMNNDPTPETNPINTNNSNSTFSTRYPTSGSTSGTSSSNDAAALDNQTQNLLSFNSPPPPPPPAVATLPSLSQVQSTSALGTLHHSQPHSYNSVTTFPPNNQNGGHYQPSPTMFAQTVQPQSSSSNGSSVHPLATVTPPSLSNHQPLDLSANYSLAGGQLPQPPQMATSLQATSSFSAMAATGSGVGTFSSSHGAKFPSHVGQEGLVVGHGGPNTCTSSGNEHLYDDEKLARKLQEEEFLKGMRGSKHGDERLAMRLLANDLEIGHTRNRMPRTDSASRNEQYLLPSSSAPMATGLPSTAVVNATAISPGMEEALPVLSNHGDIIMGSGEHHHQQQQKEPAGGNSKHPTCWTECPNCPPDNTQKYHLIDVMEGSPEWDVVSQPLIKAGFKVDRVGRIQNEMLWQRLCFEKQLMLRDRRSCNERFLYHTSRAEVSIICEEGLDPRLSRSGLFGTGIYFRYIRVCVCVCVCV